jgi:hypothetical protein
MKTAVFAAAALLPASMLVAQTGPSQVNGQSDTTITVKGKKDQKVCRNFPAPTGSRFGGGRVCKTVEEWQVEEARIERKLNQQDLNRKANQAQDWNDINQGAFGKPLPR